MGFLLLILLLGGVVYVGYISEFDTDGLNFIDDFWTNYLCAFRVT